mmetsp:Transcript_41751/g.99037  ORF Transcript_41751/g.99037 Transcript_41751/m.99037 type:complete len:263 (-) Transcript_41751:308-1096(-)
MRDNTLFIVAEPVLEGKTLRLLEQQGLLNLDAACLVSNSGFYLDSEERFADLKRLNGTYHSVISVSKTAGFHNPAKIGRLATLLSAGGTVFIQEPETAGGLLHKSVLFSGLQNCQDGSAFSSGAVAVTAQKPAWDQGAKQMLKKRMAQKATEKAKVWTVVGDEEDDDMIDDENLLTEDDLKRPVVSANDDCEVGKGGKKACKNCTCGRADGTLTEEQMNNPTSACGSCYLGDAFRCSTCPYRGLPAFKPGEKITLPTDVVDV